MYKRHFTAQITVDMDKRQANFVYISEETVVNIKSHLPIVPNAHKCT